MSVLVCSADVRREVDTVAGLDDVLDAIAANGEPILVELAGKSTVMNVGVGRKDVAVVLFRDADGRPWCARSGDDWSNAGADLEFAKNGTACRFFAHAAVTPTEMRGAARRFVRAPGVMPSVLMWVPEGVGAGASDGGAGGS